MKKASLTSLCLLSFFTLITYGQEEKISDENLPPLGYLERSRILEVLPAATAEFDRRYAPDSEEAQVLHAMSINERIVALRDLIVAHEYQDLITQKGLIEANGIIQERLLRYKEDQAQRDSEQQKESAEPPAEGSLEEWNATFEKLARGMDADRHELAKIRGEAPPTESYLEQYRAGLRKVNAEYVRRIMERRRQERQAETEAK